MGNAPFTLFEPLKDVFDVRFFTKEDAIRTDDDLAQALGDMRIASLRQMHGHITHLVDAPTSRTLEGDALMTNTKNLWLSIRAADCQQLIVYDPVHHAAGVIHAGWKGLKAGAIASLFDAMHTQWNTNPADVLVGIGPSLCTACAEFTDPVTELAGLDPAFFHGRNADLQGIADAQLTEIGVPEKNRERIPDCTRCSPELYWTFRGGDREAVQSGNTNVIACRLV